VKVVNMAFQSVPEEEAAPEKTNYMAIAAPAARLVAPILAVILLSLFVLRPLVQSLSAGGGGSFAYRGSISPSAGEIAAAMQGQGLPPKELPVRDQVAEWARKNPQDAANVIKGWIR
jgi:flagellar biosynthesis/type III secretory pathway M-ring protein FliF/YscJ